MLDAMMLSPLFFMKMRERCCALLSVCASAGSGLHIYAALRAAMKAVPTRTMRCHAYDDAIRYYSAQDGALL